MRVAIVSNTYPPHDISGVGTLASELAAQLRAAGHEALVLTRRGAPGAPAARATGGSKLLFPLRAGREYLRAARGAPFDVVHVHESDGVVVVCVARLARLLRRPAGAARIVATLQVSYVRERRSVRPVRLGGRAVSRPSGSERVFAFLRAPLLAWLGRATARLADRVVAPSRATARELAEDYGARDVLVIPNGIAVPPEAEREAPSPPGRLPAGSPTVLYAGRLRTRKAVAVLLEAFARLLETRPAARLVVVGDGEQRRALEARAARLGIASAVRFAGAQPRAAMPGWYAAARVFCLPSLYEGFPLAILEAMAASLPVVATTVAGVPEAVDDGVTGRLVPPEDATALAGALAELLDDPPRARRMGEAARRRVVAELAIPTVAAAYLDLWRSLAGPAGGSGGPEPGRIEDRGSGRRPDGAPGAQGDSDSTA